MLRHRRIHGTNAGSGRYWSTASFPRTYSSWNSQIPRSLLYAHASAAASSPIGLEERGPQHGSVREEKCGAHELVLRRPEMRLVPVDDRTHFPGSEEQVRVGEVAMHQPGVPRNQQRVVCMSAEPLPPGSEVLPRFLVARDSPVISEIRPPRTASTPGVAGAGSSSGRSTSLTSGCSCRRARARPIAAACRGVRAERSGWTPRACSESVKQPHAVSRTGPPPY